MLVTRQPVLRRFWYALMPVSRLDPGPQAFTLLGEAIVLFRGRDGKPAALRDRCCHRTARLSKGWVDEGQIVCGYHGWTYDACGRCVRIPQAADGTIPEDARVPAYHCTERYGYVWVALEDPLRPIPDFPEDGAPGFRRIFQFYQEWQTSPVRMLENSFDNSHFSFVHRATFGILSQPQPAKYDLRETEYGFEAETHVPIANPPASWRITGSKEATVMRHLVNRYYLPFARRFGCSYDIGEGRTLSHIIYNCATPITDDRMMLVQWLYRSDTEADCSERELIEWDGRITREDQDILEATDPDACIDVRRRVERSMPSDRPGLTIRRQLLALLTEHGESEVFRA